MKANEKKLVILAALVFAALVLFRLVPWAQAYYVEGQNEIARLERQIDRYRNLIEETGRWMEREESMRERVAGLDAWVFKGSTPPLIASSVQQELRKAGVASNVSVRSLSAPRYEYTDGWLRVNQQMTFTIDQDNILKFLNLLEQTRPRLLVTEFSISRNRREYTGNITVTGFSKLPGAKG
ncbi:MAG: type II secretion system protein GspM [Pseudomonadales bacterium]|nr:type II secretion system protein GspM [Pseudomonadales bacterium]